MSLKELWSSLSQMDSDVDKVERAVDLELMPKEGKGRVTPFFLTERFEFPYFDYEEKSFPLVQSAGRVTHITRLNYSVEINFREDKSAPLGKSFSRAMRPTPRGMAFNGYWEAPTGAPLSDSYYLLSIFDFEWGLTLGTTERRYVTGLSQNTRRMASGRRALGNPENNNQLLFCEKNPLVLKTNEFLTFQAKPLFYYVHNRQVIGTGQLDPDVSISLNVTCAGHREFGYGD
jgi:hypothetical protein